MNKIRQAMNDIDSKAFDAIVACGAYYYQNGPHQVNGISQMNSSMLLIVGNNCLELDRASFMRCLAITFEGKDLNSELQEAIKAVTP